MEFSITGVSRITMEYQPTISSKSKHVATDFFLEVSDNLDSSQYNNDGLPTKVGTKALSQAFIQGLVGNIHNAHQKGFWDSAEHLRYIIAELEKGFATPATPSKGVF